MSLSSAVWGEFQGSVIVAGMRRGTLVIRLKIISADDEIAPETTWYGSTMTQIALAFRIVQEALERTPAL
jgi:hypothetical protein